MVSGGKKNLIFMEL